MKAVAVALAAFLAAGCASSLGGTLGIAGYTLGPDAEGRPLGVQVLGLVPRSPLAAEGVRPGDVLVTLDGTPVESARDLGDRVAAAGFGKPIRVGVRRGEDVREISVVPAEARRKIHLGFRIPFLGGWNPATDTVTIGTASLVDIGVGPDGRGLLLASCVGYWSRPEGWGISLAVLQFGSSYRIDTPAAAEVTTP